MIQKISVSHGMTTREPQIAGDAQHKLERGEPLASAEHRSTRREHLGILERRHGVDGVPPEHATPARIGLVRRLGAARDLLGLAHRVLPERQDHTYKLRVEGRTMCDGCRCNDAAIERHLRNGTRQALRVPERVVASWGGGAPAGPS